MDFIWLILEYYIIYFWKLINRITTNMSSIMDIQKRNRILANITIIEI
jgi:hypothetical protein